jgi:hypothetical protein
MNKSNFARSAQVKVLVRGSRAAPKARYSRAS